MLPLAQSVPYPLRRQQVGGAGQAGRQGADYFSQASVLQLLSLCPCTDPTIPARPRPITALPSPVSALSIPEFRSTRHTATCHHNHQNHTISSAQQQPARPSSHCPNPRTQSPAGAAARLSRLDTWRSRGLGRLAWVAPVPARRSGREARP